MIGTGRKYTAFSPKLTKTGKTYFSVMDYDKNNPSAKRYVTVFCQNEIELYDRAKIVIENINGIGLGEYNGKQTVSMFASVRLDEESSFEEGFNTGAKVDILDSDLPF